MTMIQLPVEAPAFLMAEFEVLASSILDDIARMSAAEAGVSRPAFSAKETEVLEYLRSVCMKHGLSARYDAGQNLVMSLPEHIDAPHFRLIGSHVDSVEQGGNFDGLAGVVAGLVCLVAAGKGLVTFEMPVKAIAMRAEESAWFGPCYIGSKALMGTLGAAELAARNKRDGQTLDAHMAACGVDMTRVRAGVPLMDPASIAEYLEVHIEQGPVLVERDLPLAIVTGIRGNFRFRQITCVGESGHSGAVPRAYRHDPVLAMADLMARLDHAWQLVVDAGEDLVVTSGVVTTNEKTHALSRIPEAVQFSLDIRSDDAETLKRFQQVLQQEIRQIEASRKVRFDTGAALRTDPAGLSPGVTNGLEQAVRRIGLTPLRMVSGGGHDAAVFAGRQIPTGMIFLRNDHGSHNPDEAMQVSDLMLSIAVLCEYLGESSGKDAAGPEQTKEVSMLQDIVDIIADNKGAVKAFRKASQVAFEDAARDAEQAIGFLLLGNIAADFADAYDETPLLDGEGDKCLAELRDYAERLDRIYSGDADKRFAAVSEIAREMAEKRQA